MSTVSPRTARLTFRALEPVHGMIYFTPHGPEKYRALGLTDPRMMYFAARSAAMGQVRAEVTIATFFNFNPDVVRAVVPAAWEIASPAAISEARLAAADASLRQVWDISSAQVREAAELARQAAERACERPQGRPLFAAHAALPWPEEPHLVLWHAQSLLREYRGDAHVALLMTEGLSGIEALITHGATGEIAAEILRMSRFWSEEQWATAVHGLRERGWLAPEGIALSEQGAARREAIENRTDELSVFGYEAIGEDGCERLRTLGGPLAVQVIEGGLGLPTQLLARYRQTAPATAQ